MDKYSIKFKSYFHIPNIKTLMKVMYVSTLVMWNFDTLLRYDTIYYIRYYILYVPLRGYMGFKGQKKAFKKFFLNILKWIILLELLAYERTTFQRNFDQKILYNKRLHKKISNIFRGWGSKFRKVKFYNSWCFECEN